jgi:P-type Mg2+ transporter
VDTIDHLAGLGFSLKMITGDHHLIAVHAAQQVGLSSSQVLTGPELHRMSDEALLQGVNDVERLRRGGAQSKGAPDCRP